MPIPYALSENKVTAEPDDYEVVVQPIGSADGDALVRRMIERRSTTTRADISAGM